jgi:hypothetical protein
LPAASNLGGVVAAICDGHDPPSEGSRDSGTGYPAPSSRKHQGHDKPNSEQDEEKATWADALTVLRRRPPASLPARSTGTILGPFPSNNLVARTASLTGIAVMLGLLGCQGGDQAATVSQDTTPAVVTTEAPERRLLTAEEKVLRWIRSCEARRIIFGHEALYVGLQGGETVRLRLDKTAEEAVAEAAYAQRCEDFERIIVGIE